MFFKLSVLALTFLVTPLCFFGQTLSAVSASNADWKNYRLGAKDISVFFPKLPALYSEDDFCRGYERRTYAAYADEVVYTAVVTSATKEKPPSWCVAKSVFGRKILDLRIEELINGKKVVRELLSPETRKSIRLTGDRDHIVVFDDTENSRFIELWITHHEGLRVDMKKFWDSLQLTETPGIDVNDGAVSTIGDTVQKTYADELWAGSKVNELDRSFYIVHRPRARYTESARENEVEGSVRLKIALLASGTVGTITPLTTLPHGLTEQAIYAARRTVFLPKKVKGMNVSVIVTVDYGFSIF